MWEASWLTIDGMMERLGETVGLAADDQKRETAHLPGPTGANSRILLVEPDPSHEADRDVDDGFRPPTIIGASGWGANGRDSLWVTSCVLDGDPRDRQFPEGSPRLKSERRADQEREAKMTNVDRARFPHLWVVVPSHAPVMDKRGTDQTGVDDRASVAACSVLVDVLPSDADSVTGNPLASPMDHMTDKKVRA